MLRRSRRRWGPCGPRISVIVPTLQEALRIGGRIAELRDLDLHELIVVDGGSTDRTPDLAEAAGARVIRAARGRGQQLNAGARAAEGDVLWFVHADVRVPADAPARIRAALADDRVVGGAFRTRTVDDVGARYPRLLRVADLRASYTGLPYGDQAVFVRREAFDAVGGFPEIPLFEDLALSKRLRRVGRLAMLPGPVEVSGRRFLARPWRSLIAMNVLPVAFRAGLPVGLLERLYGQPR